MGMMDTMDQRDTIEPRDRGQTPSTEGMDRRR
jgi:hypothetical protein